MDPAVAKKARDSGASPEAIRAVKWVTYVRKALGSFNASTGL
jgi:hypothetical protein